MRTKTLLLTAALSAAGVATSMAQVYSVNAVGYVNITVGAKANLIANPLNSGDNKLNTVFALDSVPDGTIVNLWNPALGAIGGFGDTAVYFGGLGFDNNLTIAPGTGFYLVLPDGTPATPVTFVGEVPQGTPVPGSPTVTGGGRYSLLGVQVPQDGGITTVHQFPAKSDDQILQFNPATQGFNPVVPVFFGPPANVWDPAEPSIGIAQGFFAFRDGAQTSSTWTRNFSVSP